jgi:Trk-type K+ transport system membrane component
MSPKLSGIKQQWLVAKHAYLRFTSRFVPAIRLGGNVLGVLTFIASLICLTGLIVKFGFDHSPANIKRLTTMLHGCQILFIVNIIYRFTLQFRQTVRQSRLVKWIVDVAVFLTVFPLIYPHPAHPIFPLLDAIVYSKPLLYIILASYCVVDISLGIINFLSKRTNPSLILSVSFLLLIFIGSMLLMMPRCTVNGLEYVDALFISTSAICITGLTPVDIASTFTPTGLLILAILIQTGGLGLMTFTSFFALFFSGNTSVYSQLMVGDMVYSKSMSSLLPTLLYILGFTVVIELLGAIAIFCNIHGLLGMSLEDEVIFACFHSLSAFCNAGFSNIDGGLSNPMLMHSNQYIYITITVLVAAGGIGFPILVNFKQALFSRARKLWHKVRNNGVHHEPVHLYDLNTKVVLVTTCWVMLISTLLFLIFEYNNSLAGMSFGQKLIQSWFNSFVPRSSGFASVNPSGFMSVTILMFMFLMWVGGASQSTAGGIKVNTFATMLLHLKAIILGREKVIAFGRTIAPASVRRAHAVIGLSILSLLVYAIVLVGLEPNLPLRDLIYEAISALFTVGSSLGVTPLLSDASKILLSTAMFLGRVGIISLLIGIVGVHSEPPYRLPTDNIIIS